MTSVYRQDKLDLLLITTAWANTASYYTAKSAIKSNKTPFYNHDTNNEPALLRDEMTVELG